MVIVAIAGGTGSGKTTLSKKIIDSYKNIKVNYLSLDSYYKDYSNLSFSERAKINFDHPDSIDFDLFSLFFPRSTPTLNEKWARVFFGGVKVDFGCVFGKLDFCGRNENEL